MAEEKTISGKIEGIEVGKTKTGKNLFKAKVDGKIYSTFQNISSYNGKFVEFAYKENENPKGGTPFKNIIDDSIKEVSQPTTQAATNQGNVFPAQFMAQREGEEKRRIRSMALAYAKDIAVSKIAKGDAIEMTGVIKLAEVFAKYVWEGC